ncbi:LysR family transcriptional regulator [Niveispirillum sp. BGYR6]|uniref:LysR family transcriptional regulator n=1 Tax=Niveispirillum sp. BGYR6 TaxID=2971249 RepID=UPI0022B968A5|nr:LysR family transcriptional regulator [Niveispirillum sp. BGYR6]MDG5496286.1 LysR family transcriptional regulator [Niveispirillum sp. BGYR6]
MKDIDWALLRSFLAVVETGSLSAAALRSATTQPTLSRHIRELERLLGVLLFTRSARGLQPTEAALRLIDDARAMGQAAQRLGFKAQGQAQTLRGTVRLTASVIVANLLLPSLIVALRQAEPLIQVEIVASDTIQNLLHRDADIAIRMVAPTQQALIARKLGDTPIGLFASRDYAARHGLPETVQDLAAHTLLGFDRSDMIIRLAAENGLSLAREDFALRCDDQMLYWHLLLAGAGLGFAQHLLARRQPDLLPVPLPLRCPSLPVWLVMQEDVRTNPRIRRVADFLGNALAEMLGRG